MWTGAQAVISLPLNVVATAVTARLLSAGGYGRLAFLIIVFAVIQQITDFGITSSAVQWGSAARAHGDDGRLRTELSRVTGFHLAVQGPINLVVALVILEKEGVGLGLAYGLVTYAFLYLSGGSLALVLDQRNDLLARVALVTNLVSQSTVIITAVATHDVFAVLLARAATACLPGTIAIFLARPGLRSAVLRPANFVKHSRSYWRFASFSWAAACLSLLVYSRSEILVLRAVSTPAQTGLFALAFGVSQQLTTPVDSLVAPLVPATASLLAAHAAHVVTAVRRAVSLASLLAGVFLAGAVPVVYGIFSTLYGSNFASGSGLFLALGVMSTLQTATSIFGIVVQAQRKGRSLLIANAVALGVNLGLALALAPTFGAWGAMIANACGQGVSIGLLVLASSSGNGGLSISQIVSAMRPWIAALPALGIAIAYLHAANAIMPAPLSAVTAGAIGTVLYFVCLRVSRSGPETAAVDVLVSALPGSLRAPTSALLSRVAVP